LRLVGYEAKGASYWIAASRFDLTAEQIAHIEAAEGEDTQLLQCRVRTVRLGHKG